MEIKLTYIPSKKGKKWKTANELRVELSDKSVLIIPENFETDLTDIESSREEILSKF